MRTKTSLKMKIDVKFRHLRELVSDTPLSGTPFSWETKPTIVDVVAAVTGCSWDESYKKLFDVGFEQRKILTDAHVLAAVMNMSGLYSMPIESFNYKRVWNFLVDSASKSDVYVIVTQKQKGVFIIRKGVVYVPTLGPYASSSVRKAFLNKKILAMYAKRTVYKIQEIEENGKKDS